MQKYIKAKIIPLIELHRRRVPSSTFNDAAYCHLNPHLRPLYTEMNQ